MNKKFLWVEEYAPQTVEECILPNALKTCFQNFVNNGEFPNLLFAGPAGIGKTSTAKALCKQLGVSFIVVNGSDEGRYLDHVRNKVLNFSSTVSLTGHKHKAVIIDEADNMTADVQSLLRANIEKFQDNCRFIFTCNFKNKIMEPLHSRCSVFDFTLKKKEEPLLLTEFCIRLKNILNENKIQCDDKVIAKLVKKHFPDWRRVLNEAQRHASSGIIDTNILSDIDDVNLASLLKSLKNKEFSIIRKWVNENLDNDPNIIFRKIYDTMYDSLDAPSIPAAVLILAKYQYQIAFVADQEINLLACLTEIMVSCKFK
jgi:DNA polymerase III delta prime subunit